MSVFGNIRQTVSDWLNRAKQSLSSLKLFNIGSQGVYTPIKNSDAIDEGFNKSTAVYAIVMKAAEKFAVVPRYVYQKDKTEEKAYKKKAAKTIYEQNKDLVNLLNRPNDTEGQDAFLTKVAASFISAGEAFVWLNRGDVGEMEDNEQRKQPVLEMYVLPVKYMIVVPDPENLWGVLDYKLSVNGREIPLGKANVIHWKKANLKFDPNTGDHLRGMTPLEPGADTVQQYKDATRSSVRMYQNDGAKVVLTMETPLDPTQSAAIDGVINRKINNHDIKGAVVKLQGKYQYIDLGRSNTDLGLLDGKKLTWKELCFLIGVPYAYFNPEIPYADQNKAGIDFVSNTIIPMCKQFDGELNRMILEGFNVKDQAFVASDFTELPEVREGLYITAERLSKLWMVTPDEIREILGYEPLGGDFAEPWVPTGYTPMSQMNDGFSDQVDELAKRNLV